MGLHARQFDPDDRGPLDGLRVLDMSRLVAGNMLTLQLADFGAEVVKIEALPNGDPASCLGRQRRPDALEDVLPEQEERVGQPAGGRRAGARAAARR